MKTGGFRTIFYRAFADGGWLGVTIPERSVEKARDSGCLDRIEAALAGRGNLQEQLAHALP